MKGGVDPRPAFALGGGVGHAGDVCGAILGGAVAVGELVGDHVADVRQAKDKARELVLPFYRDFQAEFGDVDCRPLSGFDLSTAEGFQAYRASTAKDERCRRFVIYAVRRLLPLVEQV
ncbi:MAG: C-GCAxxG-C-C family protein [Chloroflexi bacterium]|nr:C-GCAxxG-C-C family protein [Chloroflexota bacterium]